MNKFTKISVVTLYFCLSLILMLDNFLIKWVIYEFSMILTIGILNTMKMSSKIVSILYYSVSSISSIMLMFFIVIYNNISVMSSANSTIILKFFIVMMFMKLSMFPFHNWMIFCYEKSSWMQIFLLSSIMKFIPISFFCQFINLWDNMVILLIFNSVFMSAYVSVNFSLKKLLACSTSFNNFLMLLMLTIGVKQFVIFLLFYSLSIYYLTSMLHKMSCSKLFMMFDFKIVGKIFMAWMLIYSMLPMMLTFVVKWNLMYEMSKFNSLVSFMYLIFLISNLLIVWKYMVIIKKAMMMSKFSIYIKLSYKMEILTISLTLFFIVMFLFFNFINN
uniref:NADH dehydrogenase subunit 2 n=1 Tax=Tetragonula iridipennis TaxID=597212 RepID=UPI0026E27F41|nr:NADH dehydrogenase subunit 2 [Tetragonula iridipennis]WJQ22753.1 NADH dehydrogenase subunit 2 [Tetragonula iridipennis]